MLVERMEGHLKLFYRWWKLVGVSYWPVAGFTGRNMPIAAKFRRLALLQAGVARPDALALASFPIWLHCQHNSKKFSKIALPI